MYDPVHNDPFVKFVKEKKIDVWLWTVNKRQEFQKAVDTYGDRLVGVCGDDPSIFTKEGEAIVETLGFGYKLNLSIKSFFYSWMVYGLDKGWNMTYVFMALKKVGFI
ncbi:unnamed protein product [Ambrosiozyma monospora]|uniref:Unnamed protein product n=1 Tax=Ambrosiozyma monospora TaxID=43982 RepID=A0ACB5SS66_AMBMO|nr:unnamed protein product [Ambrosiozyma monospora]